MTVSFWSEIWWPEDNGKIFLFWKYCQLVVLCSAKRSFRNEGKSFKYLRWKKTKSMHCITLYGITHSVMTTNHCVPSQPLCLTLHSKYFWHYTQFTNVMTRSECKSSQPLYVWHNMHYIRHHIHSLWHHTTLFMMSSPLYLTSHPLYVTSRPLYLYNHMPHRPLWEV